jgi:hypothetical protein
MLGCRIYRLRPSYHPIVSTWVGLSRINCSNAASDSPARANICLATVSRWS